MDYVLQTRLQTAANSVAPSLTRALALYGNRIGEECTIGPIVKNPPKYSTRKTREIDGS